MLRAPREIRIKYTTLKSTFPLGPRRCTSAVRTSEGSLEFTFEMHKIGGSHGLIHIVGTGTGLEQTPIGMLSCLPSPVSRNHDCPILLTTCKVLPA